MAGADMYYLWDMCSELFRTTEDDELVPGQFNSPPTKRLCAEVQKEETKVGEAAGVINSSRSTARVYTDQLLVPHDLVSLLITYHTGSPLKGRGPRGVINQCPIIPSCFVTTGHRTEPPPLTHTHCHLNEVVACHLCPFTSESTGPLENHIKDVHGGKFLEGQLTDVESTELVTKL